MLVRRGSLKGRRLPDTYIAVVFGLRGADAFCLFSIEELEATFT